MVIDDGIIVSATMKELYGIWLQQWSEIFDFNDYVRRMKLSGTNVVEEQ